SRRPPPGAPMHPMHPAVRATFRTTGRLAPPLAVGAAYRAFLTMGPRTPVRGADRATHDSARRDELRLPGGRAATSSWAAPGGPSELAPHGWRWCASRFARLGDGPTRAGPPVLALAGVAPGV